MKAEREACFHFVVICLSAEWSYEAGESDIRGSVRQWQWHVYVYAEHYQCRDCRVFCSGSEALHIVSSIRVFIVRYVRFYS